MSNFSQESAVLTATPVMPLAYYGGAATLVPGNAKVTVNFAAALANTCNGVESALYRVSYKKTTDTVWLQTTLPATGLATGAINATTIDITGLSNATQYQFTVATNLTPYSSS